MKLNKEGQTFIDVAVATLILAISLIILFQFLNFLKDNKDSQDINIQLLQAIQNETEMAYRSESWVDLPSNEYETSGSAINTSFSEVEITVFDTELVTLTVSVDGFSQSVEIERSVYWND